MFFDPGKFGKEYFQEMEGMFIKQMNEMISNPEVLSKVGKGMSSGFENKKILDDAMKAYLEKTSLPSKDDTARIMQYLQQIENRILLLEEKVDLILDRLPEKKKSSKS